MLERKKFDENMALLKKKVHVMLDTLVEQFKTLEYIIKKNDRAQVESLISKDQDMNDLETSINDLAHAIIIRECPVARDLRTIMMMLKNATDLERIGDYAVNIARYVLHTEHVERQYVRMVLEYFPPLFKMLDTTKEVIETEDSAKAYDLSKMDEAIDHLYEAHVKSLIRIIAAEISVNAEEAARLLFVIKQFERAGDHITNIAESALFISKAERVKLN